MGKNELNLLKNRSMFIVQTGSTSLCSSGRFRRRRATIHHIKLSPSTTRFVLSFCLSSGTNHIPSHAEVAGSSMADSGAVGVSSQIQTFLSKRSVNSLNVANNQFVAGEELCCVLRRGVS